MTNKNLLKVLESFKEESSNLIPEMKTFWEENKDKKVRYPDSFESEFNLVFNTLINQMTTYIINEKENSSLSVSDRKEFLTSLMELTGTLHHHYCLYWENPQLRF